MMHHKTDVPSDCLMPCLIFPPRLIIVSSSSAKTQRLKIDPYLASRRTGHQRREEMEGKTAWYSTHMTYLHASALHSVQKPLHAGWAVQWQ